MTATLLDALRRAEDALAAAGLPSPRSDAELLAAHVASIPLTLLRTAAWRGDTWNHVMDDGGTDVPVDLAARFDHLVSLRCGRVPLQHLTGVAAFRTLELAVGPGVFIPRPETEIVAQAGLDALASLEPAASLLAVDLCTGSGALAASLLAEGPANLCVIAVDASLDALAYARRNLASSRAALICADVTQPLPLNLDGQVDLVVSNPPYLAPHQTPEDPETTHDPQAALYGGGADGLDLPTAIVHHAERLLRGGGTLVLEHDPSQAKPLHNYATRRPRWHTATTLPDLASRPRALRAQRGGTG